MLSLRLGKRPLSALLLAGTLFVATVAAGATVGFGERPSEEVAIKARHVGDTGTYRLSWAGADVADRPTMLAFAWGPTETITGAGGGPVQANRLSWQVDEQEGAWWVQPDGRVVVHLVEDEWRDHDMVQRVAVQHFPEDQWLCFLVHPAQDMRLRVTDRFPLHAPCHLPGGIALGDGASATVQARLVAPLPVTAVQAADDLRALLVQDDDGAFSFWHVPNIPYAVHLVAQEPDTALTMDLVGFHRGEGPSIPAGQGVGSAPTPWPSSPARPWGPDDTDAPFMFLPSQAYDAALAAPTWPDLHVFLASHPEAVVVEAAYSGDGDGQQPQVWRFKVTDGTRSLRFAVLQQTAVPDADGLLPFLFVTEHQRDEPVPASLPPRQAHLAWTTLFAALDAHIDIRSGVTDHVEWNLSLHCSGDPCIREVFRYHNDVASDDLSDTTPALDPSPQPQSDLYLLRFDDEGHLVGVRAQQNDHAGTTLRLERMADRYRPSQDAAGYTPTSVAGKPPISVPELESIVAAGLVAALIGLAYTAWPSLRRLPFLFLFTRLGKKQILEHPLRQRILEVIEVDPGVHFAELAKRTDLSFGVLTHHLKKLLFVEEVVAMEGKGYTCYFLWGTTDRRLMEALPLLKSEGARRVLEAVQNRPGSTVSELAAVTGLSLSVVHHHLKRFEACGLTRCKREGRRVLQYPSDMARQASASHAPRTPP